MPSRAEREAALAQDMEHGRDLARMASSIRASGSETLRAENAKLRAALEPFARMAAAFPEWREKPDICAPSTGAVVNAENRPEAVCITFGHYFAAEAALSQNNQADRP